MSLSEPFLACEHSGMARWPTSRFGQAMIAIAVAVPIAFEVFVRTESGLFRQYAREAPYDGQDGLAAFMGALHIGFYSFVGASVGLFVIQRVITAIAAGDSISPTE